MSSQHQAQHKHQSKPEPGQKRQDPTAKPTTEQVGKILAASERAILNPTAASPQDILRLQNSAGNQAVSGLIQAKLRVGPVGDAYEQEADRVADRVAQSPPASQAAGIQREAAPEEEEMLQMKPAQQHSAAIQRQAVEEEELQMKPAASQAAAKSGFAADEETEQRLQSLRGSGQPLPSELRNEMESHLGADFSEVRLHNNSEASQLNRRLAARAFTHGKDIYLDSGEYNPGSREGKRLLAHELTHVVQQTGSGNGAAQSSSVQRKNGKGQSIEEYQEELVRHPERLSDKEKQLLAKVNKEVDPTKAKPTNMVGVLSGMGKKMEENSGVLNPKPLPVRPEQEGISGKEQAKQSRALRSKFKGEQAKKTNEEQRIKNDEMGKFEKMAYEQGIDFEKYQGLNPKAQSKFMESHVKGDTTGAEFAMQGKQELNWKDKAKFWKWSEYSKEKDKSGKSHWLKTISEDKPKWYDPTSWKTGEKKAGESYFKPWTWGTSGEKKDGDKGKEEAKKPESKQEKPEEKPPLPSKEDQEKQNEQMTKSMKDVLAEKSSKSEGKGDGSGGGKGGGGGSDYQIGKDVTKLEVRIEQLEKQIEELKKK